MEAFLKQFDTDKVDYGNYKMRFGKHKDKTYRYIYDNDKQYVKWVVTTQDSTYIKRLKEYCLERIELEYGTA